MFTLIFSIFDYILLLFQCYIIEGECLQDNFRILEFADCLKSIITKQKVKL